VFLKPKKVHLQKEKVILLAFPMAGAYAFNAAGSAPSYSAAGMQFKNSHANSSLNRSEMDMSQIPQYQQNSARQNGSLNDQVQMWAARNGFDHHQLNDLSCIVNLMAQDDGKIHIPSADIEIVRELDRGSFGIICEGMCKGTKVAIKKILAVRSTTSLLFEKEFCDFSHIIWMNLD
jgi:hypothetical protein